MVMIREVRALRRQSQEPALGRRMEGQRREMRRRGKRASRRRPWSKRWLLHRRVRRRGWVGRTRSVGWESHLEKRGIGGCRWLDRCRLISSTPATTILITSYKCKRSTRPHRRTPTSPTLITLTLTLSLLPLLCAVHSLPSHTPLPPSSRPTPSPRLPRHILNHRHHRLRSRSRPSPPPHSSSRSTSASTSASRSTTRASWSSSPSRIL